MSSFLISITVYFVIHSVLADGWLMRRVYHRWWYRFFYVSQSCLLLVPVVYFFWKLPSEPFFEPNLPVRNILYIIWVSGFTFGLYAVRSYDNMSFLGLTQFRAGLRGEKVEYVKPKLTRNGALAVVRHPYYFVSLVLIWSRPLLWKDLWLNIVLTVYFLIGTLNEERKLKKEFGQEYLDYMKEVPALIPFIKRR